MGFNKSTILDEMRALAELLRPCVYRLWRWFRESKVRHADETKWPCNGAHGQYAWGFFAKFVALFLFRKTRSGAVPKSVFAGVKDGVHCTKPSGVPRGPSQLHSDPDFSEAR